MRKKTADCVRVGKALASLVSGELGEREAEACREHVRGCRACAARLEGLERVRAGLRDWRDAEVSEGESLRLAAQLRGRLAGRRRLGIGDLVFVVGCVVFAAVGVLAVVELGGSPVKVLEGMGVYVLAGGLAAMGAVTGAVALLLLMVERNRNGGVGR